MERSSGILMPIFSLPSKYGAGSFGKESYKFVDFLVSSGQKVWQLLPLVQTGYGNSPYSSVSAESFNPYYISLETLKEQGLLTSAELKFARLNGQTVDYGELYSVRYPLLRKAFLRFDKEDKEFKRFLRKKEFYDYALYMAIKYASGQKHFFHWAKELAYRDEKALNKFARDNRDEILFWQFLQFVAQKQWFDLKKYANSKGVSILGDMPLYMALDSVDVWKNPELFKLDEYFNPTKVAGVPPDYFSKEGQLWGNPVYDYDVHQKDGFKWWCERIKRALTVYDYVRIDHFRGLDRYYQVDRGMTDARVGEWIDVPSEALFTAIHQTIDKDRIIAEDLGIIDDGVRELLSYTGYPGMKILSFAFNGEPNNLYLPQNIEENYVCYTGTHDNDTLKGLIDSATEWDYNNLVYGVENSLKLLGVKGSVADKQSLMQSIKELGLKSKAKLFIMPMQDVLCYGTEYRINQPGTVKTQNWAVRFSEKDLSKSTANALNKLTKKYNR